MEELFVENFSRQRQHERPPPSRDFDENLHKEKMTVEDPQNIFDLSISQNNDPKFDRKNSDRLLDMSIYLDRLEKEIEGGYADFADYRFIFNKIRTAFKQNSVEGVIELLNHLEELLDLGIPSLIMKKNLSQKK
jgi:hypothetical protein